MEDEAENPGNECIYENKLRSCVYQEEAEAVVTSVTQPFWQSTNPSPPDKYRPQADLFAHKPKSSGSLKLLFFCLFSTLVKKKTKKKNIKAITKDIFSVRFQFNSASVRCFFVFFPANFLCLVPVNVFCSRSCMHARLCSYYRWSLQRLR